MKRLWKLIAIGVTVAVMTVLFTLLGHAPRAAAIPSPSTVSFQGKVVNADGTNVSDIAHNFSFKLYSGGTTAGGGTLLWTEADTITTVGGVFQVNLGTNCSFFVAAACNSSTPIDFSASTNLFISMTFDSDPAGEMLPRVAFQSVPFAFQADNANNLGGRAASGYTQLSPASQQTGFINVNGAGTFGGNLSSTGTLQANGSASIGSGVAPANGVLTIGTNATSTGAGGLFFGTDTNLYRSTTNTLKTDDNVIVALTLSVPGTSAVTLGTTGSNTGGIKLLGSTAASGSLTLSGPANPAAGNFTLTIPAITANANVCTDNAVCAGYASSTSLSGYVQLSPGSQQSGFINISGNLTSAATIQGATLIGTAINATASGGTITTNLGTLQRVSTGTTTIDLKDAGTTLLQLLNSGTGVANFNLYGGDLQTGTTPTTRLSNAGALANITGYSQISGNFLQNSAGTFGTGSGLVSLNGATTAASTLGVTGLTSLNGGVTVSEAAANSMTVAATGVARTADLIAIGNVAGQEPTIDGVNALQTSWYAKPATGNLSSAQRINVTNNNTATAGQTQALRLVATGAGGAVNSDTDALYIDSLANASTGTTNENAIEIGSNWDNVISSPKFTVGGNGDVRGAGFDYFDPSLLSSATTLVGSGGSTGGNFGGAFSSGAFIENTDTYNQEFVASYASATTNNRNVGDSGNWYFNNGGNVSVTSSNISTTGGYFRITTGTTTARAGLLAYGATAGTLDKSLNATNLPIIQEKVRPSILRTTDDFFWGAFDTPTTATATNDFLPTNGFVFSTNNSTGATGWVGIVRKAGANAATVTCPGVIGTNFATGRIVIVNSTTARFFVDNDATDGVNLVDCGIATVAGGLPVVDMSIGMHVAHTTTTTSNFDMDYARWWQDDAPAQSSALADISTDTDTANDTFTLPAQTADANTPPAAPEPSGAPPDSITPAAVSQTTDQSVLVTDHSLQITGSDGKAIASIDNSDNANFDGDLNLKSATLSGGLNVGGDSNFAGLSTFQKLATFLAKTVFKDDVEFNGHVTVAADTAGTATIKKGDKQVHLTFAKSYANAPVITTSIVNGKFALSTVSAIDPKGFDIMLQSPATDDIQFNWIAFDSITPPAGATPPVAPISTQ